MVTKLQIQKDNGLFNLRPLYDWLNNALDGIYRLEIKRVRKPRSNDHVVTSLYSPRGFITG